MLEYIVFGFYIVETIIQYSFNLHYLCHNCRNPRADENDEEHDE